VRPAVGSGEPPVEDEKDVLLAPKTGESKQRPVKVGEFEIWSRVIDLNVRQSHPFHTGL